MARIKSMHEGVTRSVGKRSDGVDVWSRWRV